MHLLTQLLHQHSAPDEAFVSHPKFASFVTRLQEVTNVEVRSFDSFVEALEQRIEFFCSKRM